MVEITDAYSLFTSTGLNLDFLRLYFSFCLHLNVATWTILMELQLDDIMALEFVKAVFPVILFGITFIVVKLHDNKSLTST